MTKQEILDKLEEITDVMDTDFLNRYDTSGITDIKEATALAMNLERTSLVAAKAS